MGNVAFKTKLSYGIIGISDAAFYNLIGSFALFYFTEVIGLDASVAGTIIGLGAVWQTISGTVVASISDNSNTRLGKRKPFLLVSAFPLALFTFLMFTNIHLSSLSATLYYGFLMIMVWTAFSTFFIPYLSWGAEIVKSYNERTVLRGFVSIFNSVGLFFGMVLPNIIIDVLSRNGFSIDSSWQCVGLICGILPAITIFIGALNIKDSNELGYVKSASSSLRGKKKHIIFSSVKKMILGYFELLHLRSIRFLIAASFFYLISNTFFAANRMYFFTYCMNLSPSMITIVLSFPIFTAFLFVPIITFFSKKIDKKSLFIVGLSISAAGMLMSGITGINSLFSLFINYLFFSIGSTTYWQLMPSTIYDICEVDQLINEKKRAGLITSLQSFSESLSNALGFQLLGVFLKIAGFNGMSSIQTDTALIYIYLFFSIIPALLVGGAIYMILKYPVNKDVFNRVIIAIQARDNGEKINLNDFSSLK